MKSLYMLDIDLTNEDFKIVDVTELFGQWIGGAGVATRIFVDSCPKGIDPLDENSPIIFAIGPTNNHFPVITKTVAVFKSPLTGDFGESHAGGNVGMAMYQAGFHAIRIRGKAKKFSYIKIDNGDVDLILADSLRGMSSTATERVLQDRHRTDRVQSIMRIGPAAERLSPIACLSVDSSRHFGRLGLGTVLASKNIKAIVISGNRYWKISNRSYNSVYLRLYKEVTQSDLMRKYHDLGTSVNILNLNRVNGLPVRNYSQGFFEGAGNISGEAMANKHLAQKIACAGCPVGCIHIANVRVLFEKEHYMYKTKRVSYDHEPIYAFGSNLSVSSSEELLLMLQKVESQGWDVISMGVTLAWATEAFQKGLITEKETSGEIFNFGDGKVYLRILDKIANGENEFYRDLERGSYYCARKYGGEDFAIVFNKNEAPGYLTGIMTFLGYATDTRHSHLGSAGYSIDEKLKNDEVPIEERVKQLYDESIWRIIFTSISGCLFARHVYHKDGLFGKLLSAVGFESSTDAELWQKARKIHGLKYRFKLENGFKFENLILPKKLTHTISSNGILSESEFNRGIEIFREFVKSDLALLES